MSALEERRQRAREAAYDEGIDGVRAPTVHVEAAIEVATRVRITPDVLAAGYPSVLTKQDRALCLPLLAQAFRAAGFEVEQ